MKKYFLLIFTMLLIKTISLPAQIRSNRDLIGKWHGHDHGDNLDLEFFADSKLIMIVPGGKLPVATYTADFRSMPVKVTLTLTDNGQKIVYKGELEFLDNETISLRYFGDQKKHDAFAEPRSVVMKKVK